MIMLNLSNVKLMADMKSYLQNKGQCKDNKNHTKIITQNSYIFLNESDFEICYINIHLR